MSTSKNETSTVDNTSEGWDMFKGGKGAASFWIKPAFHPESSSKIRTFFDFSRYHTTPARACANGSRKSPFGLWFLPMTQSGPAAAFRDPRSLLMAAGTPVDDTLRALPFGQSEFGFGAFARTVNHEGLGSRQTAPTLLAANRWTHVALVWEMHDPLASISARQGGARMYLNGRMVGTFDIKGNNVAGLAGSILGSGTGRYNLWTHDPVSFTTTKRTNPPVVTKSGATTTTKVVTVTTTKIETKNPNTVRLGAPSVNCADEGSRYGGNFSADATMDELYLWNTADVALAGSSAANPAHGAFSRLWQRGRYVAAALNGDGFLSAPILTTVTVPTLRSLPGASHDVPSGGVMVKAPGLPAMSKDIRIRGLSWTWYGEETVGAKAGQQGLKRVLWDYSQPDVAAMATGLADFQWDTMKPSKHIELNAEVSLIRADGSVLKICRDDGFEKVDQKFDPAKDAIRYGVRFTTGGSVSNPILLGTPAFDDVTVYYSTGDATYLEYYVVQST